MSTTGSASLDLANHVKKFFYYRAFLCEEMLAGRIIVTATPPSLPPADYDPSTNLYHDAFIIACAAIDALSSMWVALDMPDAKFPNRKQFTEFMSRRHMHEDLDRVSTPFLYHFLKKQDIEQPFREHIHKRWVESESPSTLHAVHEDPSIPDLRNLYQQCSKNQIEDINQELVNFKYSALIYKYYRCAFVHEFRGSPHVAGYQSDGDDISVYENSGYLKLDGSDGLTSRIVSTPPIPELDVGLRVLTNGIRTSADYVARRIVRKGWTTIPPGRHDAIVIKTKTAKDGWLRRFIRCLKS